MTRDSTDSRGSWRMEVCARRGMLLRDDTKSNVKAASGCEHTRCKHTGFMRVWRGWRADVGD